MSFSGLFVFASVYFAVLIVPGPGVTALLARVMARGPKGAPTYIAGFVCGALIWFTIAATGLALVASAFATLFLVIRYASAGYLLYLSWKIWTAPANSTTVLDASPDSGWRLFLTGMAINLGNPKVIVFFLALLPTVVNLTSLTRLGFAELATLVAVIASVVLTSYAAVAARMRRLFRSHRAVRLINRGSGIAMAGAAAAVVVR